LRPTLLCALAVTAALAPAAALRAQAPAATEAPTLALPLACEIGLTCEVQHYVDRDPGPGVLDYRCGARTNDKHDGIDFRLSDMALQRAGVDVLAAAAGRVIAVRDGVQDISIRAPGAPSVAGHECGNRVGISLGGGWIIDYCHLANGSLKVKVGDTVAAGQPLARVGLSGDTEFPHLHFSVRHANGVVDPFARGAVARGACAPQSGLWTAGAARALAYKPGAVLNTGFSSTQVTMAGVEGRTQAPVATTSQAMVAYVRLIGLETGDVLELAITGPGGLKLAASALPALETNKAQWLTFTGAQRPSAGWPSGVYTATLQVRRAGAVAIRRSWTTRL